MVNEDKRATMAHITMLKLLEVDPTYKNYPQTWAWDAVKATDALLSRLEETTEKAEAQARVDHGIF